MLVSVQFPWDNAHHKRGRQKNTECWVDERSALGICIVCPRHGCGIHVKTLCTLCDCGPDVAPELSVEQDRDHCRHRRQEGEREREWVGHREKEGESERWVKTLPKTPLTTLQQWMRRACAQTRESWLVVSVHSWGWLLEVEGCWGGGGGGQWRQERKGCVCVGVCVCVETLRTFFFLLSVGVAVLLSRTMECCPPAA